MKLSKTLERGVALKLDIIYLTGIRGALKSCYVAEHYVKGRNDEEWGGQHSLSSRTLKSLCKKLGEEIYLDVLHTVCFGKWRKEHARRSMKEYLKEAKDATVPEDKQMYLDLANYQRQMVDEETGQGN